MSDAERADRTLRTIAVLIAAYVSFQIPSTTPAMLTLLPPLAAATPLALPAKARSWAGAAVATMLTGFTFVPGDLGLYYLPVALQLWAATIVPWVLRRGIGRVATRSWHLAAAAVIALPALLLISAFATGKFDIYWAGVALWVAGPLVVAALCAFGIRTGYALTALARRIGHDPRGPRSRLPVRRLLAVRSGVPDDRSHRFHRDPAHYPRRSRTTGGARPAIGLGAMSAW
nr:hypothetical protein GCM10020092_086080 [Actinoplanes digitatis]